MDKIKLTKDQAENIKRWPNKEQLITAKAVGLLEHGQDEAVGEMTMESLVRALYIGYEVEPEYKVGDVVCYWKNDSVQAVGTINYINYENGWSKISGNTVSIKTEDIKRHATTEEIKAEQERRAWAKIGREPGELKLGDVYKMREEYAEDTFRIADDISKRIAFRRYSEGRILGIYPAESFIEFGGADE